MLNAFSMEIEGPHPVLVQSVNNDAATLTDPAEEALARSPSGRWYLLTIGAFIHPLPDLLARMDALIGRELTLKFAKEFAGKRLYFPSRPEKDPKGKIQRVIGVAAAVKVAEHLVHTQMVAVPTGPLSPRRLSQQRLWALILTGTRTQEIVTLSGCTDRGVTKQRARLIAAGVMPKARPGAKTRSLPDPRAGAIRLMLFEGVLAADIAKHLDVPVDEVKREAVIMKTAREEAAR